MPTIVEWLTLKPLRDAVEQNEKAHAELKRAVNEHAPKGLKGVDKLLKGEHDDVATQS